MGALSYLLPDERYDSITDIEVDELDKRYDSLIIDLDRTLTDYHSNEIDQDVRTWYDEVTDRIDTVILSNSIDSNDSERAGMIESQLDTTVIRTPYSKPSRNALDDAMGELEADGEATAIIGDTTFTDIVGGNRYGLTTIQVQPRGDGEPFIVRCSRFSGDILQDLAQAIRQL